MLYDMMRTLLPSLPAKAFACSIQVSAKSEPCHRYSEMAQELACSDSSNVASHLGPAPRTLFEGCSAIV